MESSHTCRTYTKDVGQFPVVGLNLPLNVSITESSETELPENCLPRTILIGTSVHAHVGCYMANISIFSDNAGVITN